MPAPGPGSRADGLAQKGWKYNDQYGIVPIPTDQTGQTVVAPLGGAAITGTSSVSSALQTAQGTISGVQQVSGSG